MPIMPAHLPAVSVVRFCLCLLRRPPVSTLFPYPSLFRSLGGIFRGAIRRSDNTHHGKTTVKESKSVVKDPICGIDRKSTRLNSSHRGISYAVFCLKQKTRKRLSEAQTANSPDTRTRPRRT